ncbi:MAG: Rieske 2Fe-2S domain-containing protein [Holophagales bacterium]|nr:Rieske 2Fe-2S domain-containing protein [Holophagales bacterium]
MCPCHNGAFDPLSGAVLQGPRPAPSAPFPSRSAGDVVLVGPAPPVAPGGRRRHGAEGA